MELVEKVKYQVPIGNLALKLRLARRGEGFACPFCSDPECELALAEEKNRFETTRCGSHGAQIELVQQTRRSTYDEALAWLCEEYGVREDRLKADDILKRWQSEKKSLTLDDVFGSGTASSLGSGRKVEDAQIYADLVELCPMSEVASGFLERRGYPAETIRRFRLGWAANPGQIFETLDKRHGKEALGAAGLLDKRKEFVFNQHRLLFPFYRREKVLYIRARRIDDGKPPYLSLTRKNPILYPADLILEMKEGDVLYVTPDLPDCFALLNRGHRAVAVVDFQSFPAEELSPLTKFDLVAMGGMEPEGHRFNRWLLKTFAGWKKDLRVQELPPGFETWNDFTLLRKK